jgi:hypothetical protein
MRQGTGMPPGAYKPSQGVFVAGVAPQPRHGGPEFARSKSEVLEPAEHVGLHDANERQGSSAGRRRCDAVHERSRACQAARPVTQGGRCDAQVARAFLDREQRNTEARVVSHRGASLALLHGHTITSRPFHTRHSGHAPGASRSVLYDAAALAEDDEASSGNRFVGLRTRPDPLI